jgi:hypothetical protein
MTFDRMRTLWKKMAPFALGAVMLGAAGYHYLGKDCCTPGASCCFPGSPCCHGHAAASGVAQR